MSKEIQFQVQDTLSDYFRLVSEKVDEDAENHLKKMARHLTGEKGIEKHMSHRFNKNLYKSGKDSRNWLYEHEGHRHSMTVKYTGLTGRQHSSYFRTWIEFSDEFIEEGADWHAYDYVKQYYSQRELHLNRDYAYYQETGIDQYADEDDAKYTHYVEKGVDDTYKLIINKSAGYIKNITRGLSNIF